MEIEKLIEESLKEVVRLVQNLTPRESKIIIPKYRKDDNRYSEQELKQIFLSLLEKTGDRNTVYYSVETPSKNRYRFADKNDKELEPFEKRPKVILEDLESDYPEENSKSKRFQSSMIDTSIYDDESLLSHIEFKHGSCQILDIQKDFLKMVCESNSKENNYFIHYFDSSNEDTKKSVFEKYKEAIDGVKIEVKDRLDSKEYLKKVIVYLLFINSINEVYEFSLDEFSFELKPKISKDFFDEWKKEN